MAVDGPQLTPVGEKSLPAKCKAQAVAYCPTMDLIALATEDEELRVFRLNGQRVFGGSFGGDPYLGEDEEDGEIRGMAWKGNGRLLAVACGDGSLRIISSYTGKTVHHYQTYQQKEEHSNPTENPAPKATCIGWGVNFTDSKAAQRHLHESAGQVSIDDLLAPGVYPSKAAIVLKADLPRELALLDIESSLPKLSTLPATGGDDDVFSSRASLDAIFHSSKDTNDSVDVLSVGFDDGTVHLRIFDCFEIGSFPVGSSPGISDSCRILRHASHPLSSTHSLLASPIKGDSRGPLELVTMDLRFITKSGRYLSLLASKTTQLQNLLRYIGQVQRQIELEWKNAQELPARFLRSVNEDLQEKCQCDFITAIYHLVVTGHCFEPMKEFLTDIVGERGHKRWDKAVSGGYENIRRLTHECLLPALERSQVLLSRLVGLSKFHKLSDVLGLDTTKLNAIVETLDCLHLLGHRVLTHANEELGQFAAFSRWLRQEIHVLNSEPLSQTLEELQEKRDLFDVPPTVKYIKGALTKSALRNFIRQLPMIGVVQPPAPPSDKWLPGGHDRSFFDTFKSLLQQQRESRDKGGDGTSVDTPKLNDLTRRLGIQFEKVFGEIALTQRRGILHRSPLTLHSDCDQEVTDLTFCYEDSEQGQPCSIYVATRSATSKHQVYLYRVVLNSVGGVSSTRSTSLATLDLQNGEVRQLQFVNDDTLMVLWRDGKGSSHLLNFPFQPPSTQSQNETTDPSPLLLDYIECNSTQSAPKPTISATTLDLSPESPHASVLIHLFPLHGPKARPVHVDVNGRKGRRAICVLYGDAMRYEVLDLDAAMGDDDEEDEDYQEGDEEEDDDEEENFDSDEENNEN
ncbi:Anaphase-promoting complex subunit 4 [Penicillium expansum]|uniref:Anaphase-promoting complex subunit 4 n=1 Tax=Penicillium expansum TaxID=27334 RepID=A0A0A2JPT3_PENEN|nr:Anaphase-promoting complex subunit 4 [Penicillium expansum]KGO38728.1 Anaphase-promoting complex subunit 4 [Penicillium expansum]KGO45554.1 Anaphase-promoting complex subunit 4 [Penicillium expansum]KGO54255.1 Anaphase-promoting complex subunit 4 [Penicillium expansum]